MALDATQRRFTDVAEKITTRLREEDKLAKTLLRQIQLQEGLEENPRKDLPRKILHRFTETLKNAPSVYALYLGYPDGDLYEVVNMNMNDSLKRKYGAPKQSRWYDSMTTAKLILANIAGAALLVLVLGVGVYLKREIEKLEDM